MIETTEFFIFDKKSNYKLQKVEFIDNDRVLAIGSGRMAAVEYLNAIQECILGEMIPYVSDRDCGTSENFLIYDVINKSLKDQKGNEITIPEHLATF